jgi:UDP-2-acetamido-3-amino-2,3-dideoxy-glucuronate N-acetyltransferase
MTSYPALEDCAAVATSVRGVRLHQLPRLQDLRGTLTFGEVERHIPFEVRRYFVAFDVPDNHTPVGCAQRTVEQFLICVHGSCTVEVDDGRSKAEFSLSDPATGLHMGPLVWSVQSRFSPDAVLLVLASDFYDPADYIRTYQEFLYYGDDRRRSA